MTRPHEGRPGPRQALRVPVHAFGTRAASVSTVPAGSAGTKLIVLRGNSASGKSTVAAGIRSRHGRGIAIAGQDHLRRIVLRERDVPGGVNIGLIDTVARYALDRGYHVIVEGILYAARYSDMLTALRADHRGESWFYYLDVSFEETDTAPRHQTPGQRIRAHRDAQLVPGTRHPSRRVRADHR